MQQLTAIRHAGEMRRCLLDLDVAVVRRLHRHMSPHLPQPANDREALASLHVARTQCGAIPLRARAYSHRWLLDHGLPSYLPDRLKPMADRLYPRVTEGVIVSATAHSELFKPVAGMIQDAMVEVAEDTYATDKAVDGIKLRADLREARVVAINKLFGRVLAPLALKQSAAEAEKASAMDRLTGGRSHG